MGINQNISLCVIDKSTSCDDFIRSTFGISKSKLKKYALSKKFLAKKLDYKDELSLPIDLVNTGLIQTNHVSKTKVLYEDNSIIAFVKKAGFHTHPLGYAEVDNMLSVLYSDYPKLSKINKTNYDRGLLYRLDYETSGILIHSKTDELYQQVRDNFSRIFKKKVYIAIVEGEAPESFSLEHYFKASESKGSKQKVVEFSKSKGKLEAQLLDYNKEANCSLIKVNLITGLRHQIRVQLAEYGFPIVGDTLYGASKSERLFLHCYRYQLELNGNAIEVTDSSLDLFKLFFNFDGKL